MLIGAHVSPAGGLDKAVERGVERGCQAIQIFNQSPRMWRPTAYGEDDFAAFREAIGAEPDQGGADPRRLPAQLRLRGREIRDKSLRLADPVAARRRRDRRRRRRAAPRLGQAGRRRQAIKRAGKVIARGAGGDRALPAAPRGHGRRRRHARAARSRSWPRCSRPPAATTARRSAWTPATCSRPATTSAPPTGSTETLDEFDRIVGLKRLGSLHLNDSQTPLGSNRDRHAQLGAGRARRARLRGVPVRAAVRQAPVRARDRARRRGPAPRRSRSRFKLRKRGQALARARAKARAAKAP